MFASCKGVKKEEKNDEVLSFSESIYSVTDKCENSVKKHCFSDDIFENIVQTAAEIFSAPNFLLYFRPDSVIMIMEIWRAESI